jgi:hypothetical protein
MVNKRKDRGTRYEMDQDGRKGKKQKERPLPSPKMLINGIIPSNWFVLNDITR